MGENISKQAIINSFKRVKSHFLEIDTKISQNMAKLEEIEKSLKNLYDLLSELKESPKEISSIGNEGVQSNTHSLNTHSLTHSNTHFLPDSKVEILFQTLTNKEFLIFLTIFQTNYATYEQIAQKLSLTLSCVRSYVSELIRKKTPLIKRRLKNRKVILYVDNEFKTLTSEQKLINIYYKNIDPTQTTLI